MDDGEISLTPAVSVLISAKNSPGQKEEPASQYISIELWEKVCPFSPITKGTNPSGAVMDCSKICGCRLNLAMSALNGRVFGNRLAPRAAFRETPYRFFLQGFYNWFILISQSEKNTDWLRLFSEGNSPKRRVRLKTVFETQTTEYFSFGEVVYHFK